MPRREPRKNKPATDPDYMAKVSLAAIRFGFDTLTVAESANNAHLFGGMLANMVGPVPEEEWRRLLFLSEQPCGFEGCTCHVENRAVFEALDAHREAWRKARIEEGKNPDKRP